VHEPPDLGTQRFGQARQPVLALQAAADASGIHFGDDEGDVPDRGV
jgi:hypothetical protein